PDAKEAARANVVAAAASRAYGRREIVIRANGLNTLWGREDIIAIAASGAHAGLVPKLESAADGSAVGELPAEAGGPADMGGWGMMETPRGILHAEEIASASPRLACFVMGTNDLVKDLRARHTPLRLPMMAALGMAMLAARANGLAILDGVYNDIQ